MNVKRQMTIEELIKIIEINLYLNPPILKVINTFEDYTKAKI